MQHIQDVEMKLFSVMFGWRCRMKLDLMLLWNQSCLVTTTLPFSLTNHWKPRWPIISQSNWALNPFHSNTLSDIFVTDLKTDEAIMDVVKSDLRAVKETNPACISHMHKPRALFLNFKGFLTCQVQRVLTNCGFREERF